MVNFLNWKWLICLQGCQCASVIKFPFHFNLDVLRAVIENWRRGFWKWTTWAECSCCRRHDSDSPVSCQCTSHISSCPAQRLPGRYIVFILSHLSRAVCLRTRIVWNNTQLDSRAFLCACNALIATGQSPCTVKREVLRYSHALKMKPHKNSHYQYCINPLTDNCN